MARLFGSSWCSIVASSNITQCYDASSSGLTCKQKLNIALILENNQKLGSESLSFSMSSFRDASNNTLNLTTPVSLNVTKSAVTVLYTLKYRQNFAYTLNERIVKTSWPFCSEGMMSQGKLKIDSTCKYRTDSNGMPTTYSQGFCCTCPAVTLLTGLSSEPSRGSCELFGSSQTAHCLEFDKTQYFGYEIIEYVYNYNINFILSYNTGKSNSTLQTIQQQLSINKRSSTSGILNASIIGDFLPSRQPPGIVGQVLFRPPSQASPGLNSSSVQPIGDQWLVVDKSQISFDGRECNKIGTSYEAFQNQGSRCTVLAGTCLGGQIADLLASERVKASQNITGDYLLQYKGNFTGFRQSEDNTTRLEMAYSDVFTTQIGLQIDASDFRFITSLGKASFKSVKIPTFEAQTSLGTLTAIVVNIGTNTAKFEVALNCTSDIQALPSKLISLAIGEDTSCEFSLSAVSSEGKNHSCTISLTNSIGELLEQQEVPFETTERKIVDPTINTQPAETQKVIEAPSDVIFLEKKMVFDAFGRLEACEYLCPELPTLHCYLLNRCTNQLLTIGYYLIFILAASIGLLLLVFCCCLGGPLGCLGRLFTCCRNPDKKKKTISIEEERIKGELERQSVVVKN